MNRQNLFDWKQQLPFRITILVLEKQNRLSFAYFILPYRLERMLAGFPCLVNRRRIAVLSFRLHNGE